MTKTSLSFPLNGILIRVSGETGIYMSTSFGRDTAHVEFAPWLRKDIYNEAGCSLAGYQEIAQILVGDVTFKYKIYLNGENKSKIQLSEDEDIQRSISLG